ncbi:plastocyanin/azurin family copper-binding protein [Hyphomicrobium sp. 99]|uniref:plastocyanin/azurin family copper-binding protein n=1 Tax=Hyphomicrobium sp. 99 TaxID=1163419 RepID=UPI0009E2E6B5|nr:plastocyanin/azurin family copper-binding protein [Hyphomicrobium sp. 99]
MRKSVVLLAMMAAAFVPSLAFAADVDVLEGAPPADAKVVNVTIKGMKYDPANLEIAPGTIVTWKNVDAIPHNVRLPAPVDVVGNMLRAGQTMSLKFNAPGDYSYTCSPHPFMKGTVVVK